MGPLPFNLEFFTECQDMRQLLAYLDAPPETGDRESGHSGEGGGEGVTGGAERRGAEGQSSDGGGASGSEGGRRRVKERFYKMTEEICDVVDSYGLVCFYPLNIQVISYRPPMSPVVLQ